MYGCSCFHGNLVSQANEGDLPANLHHGETHILLVTTALPPIALATAPIPGHQTIYRYRLVVVHVFLRHKAL